MADASGWALDGFDDHFERWVSTGGPDADLRIIVLDWVMARHDDPFYGMRQEEGFDNLWYGRIPDSGDGRGNVVVCSYFVEFSTRTLRCNGFTMLAYPA